MAAGISLPAIIFAQFNWLSVGITVSLGALCVSVTDSPGPVKHRLNGMLYCIVLIGIVSCISYLAFHTVAGSILIISSAGFLFSMLSVYNARVSSVGISALLIMILSMQAPLYGTAIIVHTGFLVSGGIFYLLFSLLLNRIRPYKIIQQLSGDFIEDVADYLSTRALFYDEHPDYDHIYKILLQKQVKVQAQQSLLSDLLFKTRTVTGNSTLTGRALLKLFIDVSDLFESIMSAYRDYSILHKKFDEAGILVSFREQLLMLADELRKISFAIITGEKSVPAEKVKEHMDEVKKAFNSLRSETMNTQNFRDFISLGRIYVNISRLTEKIAGLHYYVSPDHKTKIDKPAPDDLPDISEVQRTDTSLFLNNLNFSSNIFRHSLRVSISLMISYLLTLFANISHGYWMLLTVVVILKPAYSLTRKRNADRLFGTIGGIVIGGVILLPAPNNYVLLAIMIVFMAAGYMFIRTKYFVSVLLMTVYLVIFFHLESPESVKMLLTDRIKNTLAGSGIALLSALFLLPRWEYAGIRMYMIDMLKNNIEYLKNISAAFAGEEHDRKALRKCRQKTLTALANLSDSLTRMLSEPKRFQKNTETIHQFVVLNHIITSHFSALSFYLSETKNTFRSKIVLPASTASTNLLMQAIDLLQARPESEHGDDPSVIEALQESSAVLYLKRKEEIGRGELETDTKKLLTDHRSVTDQFRYIFTASQDIYRIVQQYTGLTTNADQKA